MASSLICKAVSTFVVQRPYAFVTGGGRGLVEDGAWEVMGGKERRGNMGRTDVGGMGHDNGMGWGFLFMG